MESSRPLRAASAPDEAPTAVHETDPVRPVAEPVRPVTESESLAPALASSDQCANCGSRLAPDQHYCLVCGERRGPARFNAVPATGTVTTAITETRVAGRPPRFGSAATTLIAGVATLLIAMGIGVYIGGLGKSNNSGSGQPVRVLTVGGGAGSPAATGSTPATAATGGGSGAGGSKHKKSTGTKQSGSAAKVVTTVKNQPPPTVTVGATGSGKGFQKGKFTGHFFGP